MNDPSTGPIPKDKFKELVDAPFGQAAKAIQEYDPEWGRAPGDKFEWIVEVERDGADKGRAYIKAASQEEADAIAEDLTENDIDWDFDSDSFLVVSVEPAKRKVR